MDPRLASSRNPNHEAEQRKDIAGTHHLYNTTGEKNMKYSSSQSQCSQTVDMKMRTAAEHLKAYR